MAADRLDCWSPRQYIVKSRRVIFLTVVFLLLLSYHAMYLFVSPTLESIKLYENMEHDTVDNLQTCQLPLMHPFEPDVLSYFKKPAPINCRVKIPVLTFIDKQGYLRYNATALLESGYTLDSLTCTYQEILRGKEDSDVVFSEEKPLTGMDRPSSDFTYVSCSRSSWLPTTYSMYHAAVQRIPTIRSFRDDEEVGVVIVGIDSVSRLNFMRQLPKSFIALTNRLGAVVFKGFNKVGQNTLPNIVPILTGNPPGETSATSTFDDWPFLWKELNADNVATLYGEDLSHISTFTWWGAGFKKDPTTHYFHRYWVAAESSGLNAFSSPMCLGAIPKHRIYLDYLKSFIRTYQDSPTFMFSLENEPCHDYMNTVGVMDEDLEQFLLTSYEEGLFNRTILFVLADHGHRMDPYRKTLQGQLEDFMPMVSIVVPPWLAAKYPDLMENLNANSKRLTSSFDLYSTFTDIFLRTSFEKKDNIKYNFTKPKFGQSLFQKVPLERMCSDAGIPEMFCICKEDYESLSSTNPLVIKSIDILLRYMNDQVLQASSALWKSAYQEYIKAMYVRNKTLENEAILQSLGACAELTLANVEKADLVVKHDNRKMVHLKYRTAPNDGLYEGRVEWLPTGEGKIHEEITRTNRYGTQADCLPRMLLIMVPFVRSVCYCN